MTDLHKKVPTLLAIWTPDGYYMTAGVQNHGTLALYVQADNPVSLKQGDVLAIEDLPSGWTVAPGDSSWSWSNGKGNSPPPGLKWNGADPFSIGMNGAPPISLLVTPPPAPQVRAITVNLDLTKSDGTVKSKPTSIAFSLATDPSLTGYAASPALVILSNPSAVPFPNTIKGTLLAIKQVASTNLKLSFYGWDAKGNSSKLSSALGDTLEIDANGLTFTSNGDGTWSADNFALDKDKSLDLNISGLSITQIGDSPVVLLEVRCETAQDTASVWFMAFGPYTVGVALDPTGQNVSKFAFRSESDKDTFTIYFQDKALLQNNNMAQVPLLWSILDAAGDEVFPPVPARFSLNGQGLDEQQTVIDCKIGTNELRWVEPPNTAIVQCQIDVAYITSSSPGPINFSYMDLSWWDFTNWQNLGGSDRSNASNFTKAVLATTNFLGAKLDNCTMDGASMSGAWAPTNASFAGASFVGAKVVSYTSSFGNCDLSRCNFEGATLEDINFSACNFDSSTFKNATFKNVEMSAFMSEGTQQLTNVDFSGSTLTQTQIKYCDVSKANFGTATFSGLFTGNLTDPGGAPTLPPGWSLKNGQFVKG